MAEAITPLKQRTEIVEKEQLELKEQVKLLTEQLKSVEEKLTGDCTNVQTLAQIVCRDHRQVIQDDVSEYTGSHEEKIKTIISLSRRTVGLKKMDQSDLGRMGLDQFGGKKRKQKRKSC